jgi:deoxyribodipyrimidine photolyase-related protein
MTLTLTLGDQLHRDWFSASPLQLAPCWSEGSNGLPPIDCRIVPMTVISNLMVLCEIHPAEVHRWFMERRLDSYEWVMRPNVYAMGTM